MLISHPPSVPCPPLHHPSHSYPGTPQMNMAGLQPVAATVATAGSQPGARRHSPGYRSSSSWTPQEDQTLKEARGRGMNWQPIAETFFPSKSPNACRKRHERLMEREQAEEWDGVKREQLAQAYQDVRRQMWAVLGEQLGERWSVVEAKCMELGLRNLNAAARSASRRSVDPSDGVGSISDRSEYTPDYSQPSTGRIYQQEFQQPTGDPRLQLPPPNVMQPQRQQPQPPTIPPMRFAPSPQLTYGQWYPRH